MKHLFVKLLFLSLLMFVVGNVDAETKWVKTDPADLADGDVVVIVDLQGKVAMENVKNTSSPPKAIAVKLINDQLTNVGDNIQWTVHLVGEYYHFHASEDIWLYCTTSGPRVGDNSQYNNFKIVKQENNQTYYLYNIDKKKYLGVYSNQDWRGYVSTSSSNSIKNTVVAFFKKVTDDNDVALTISSVGYATLYYGDRALVVPNGVTATTYSVNDGKLAESKTYEAGEIIPEGEAVVLKGAAGEYTFTATTTEAEKDADNHLKGSDEDKPTEGGNYYYALQAKSSDGKHGPGMYWMKPGGAAFTNLAHKAYMALDEQFAGAQAVGGAKEFYLFVEATTGISGIDAASADRTEMHNLNGQRVNRGYKGVVIKDGKKFLKK